MAAAGFHSAVLHGMLHRGFNEAFIAQTADVSPKRLKAVFADKAQLTYRQIVALEERAGMTAGQLAALYLEPRGGSFTQLADKLASCRSKPLKRRRQTKKLG